MKNELRTKAIKNESDGPNRNTFDILMHDYYGTVSQQN